MDPDAVLAELREMAQKDPQVEFDRGHSHAERLEQWGNLFDALDTWLSSGGFFPAAWAQPQPIQEAG